MGIHKRVILIHSLPWRNDCDEMVVDPGYGVLDVTIDENETYSSLLERLQGIIAGQLVSMVLVSTTGWATSLQPDAKMVPPYIMFPKTYDHYTSCVKFTGGKVMAFRGDAEPDARGPIANEKQLDRCIFAILRDQDIYRIECNHGGTGPESETAAKRQRTEVRVDSDDGMERTNTTVVYPDVCEDLSRNSGVGTPTSCPATCNGDGWGESQFPNTQMAE